MLNEIEMWKKLRWNPSLEQQFILCSCASPWTYRTVLRQVDSGIFPTMTLLVHTDLWKKFWSFFSSVCQQLMGNVHLALGGDCKKKEWPNKMFAKQDFCLMQAALMEMFTDNLRSNTLGNSKLRRTLVTTTRWSQWHGFFAFKPTDLRLSLSDFKGPFLDK